MKIAVLIACHNRRLKTIECIKAVNSQILPIDISLKLIVTDDGSTDGTYEAIRKNFPDVVVLKGNGDLYWNKGMCFAFNWAFPENYDAYLLLNDDTYIFNDAIYSMIETLNSEYRESGNSAIIIGTTKASYSDTVTYGGLIRKGKLRPFSFMLADTRKKNILCTSMNGNCVLVPSCVVKKIGFLDEKFRHAMGDIDFGLRATKADIKLIATRYIGICDRNPIRGTYFDEDISFSTRLKLLLGPRGLPWRSWLLLTKRHGGLLYPIYFAWPYIRFFISVFRFR